MNQEERALIIGGGIAGLTTAIALRRAGIAATVFERADPLHRPNETGIILQQNALRAYQQLELADQLSARGEVLESLEHRTSSGALMARWQLGKLSGQVGAPTIGMTRPELHTVLTEVLDAGVLHLAREYAGFVQDPTGVTARFADGREERGDLLIGADGADSTVRAQLLADGQPRHTGYTVWEGIATVDDPRAPAGIERMLWGRGLRFVCYYVGPQRLAWLAAANVREGAGEPQGSHKDRLLWLFRGWLEPTEAVIASTEEDDITQTADLDRRRAKSWGTGRATLVGDAAHPMSFTIPQAIAQAAEDASVLSQCLHHERDIAAALDAYYARRIGRTGRIAMLTRAYGAAGRWKDPLRCAVRNGLLRVLLNTMAWKIHQQDMAYDFGSLSG